MSNQKKYSIDMINGPLAGKILRFALPFMLANIIQLLFNAADVMVVGKFAGDTAQAAVSSTASLINLLINLFVGLGVGVNVVVARALGSGDRSRINAVVHTAVATGIAAGLFLVLVGQIFAPMLLRLMGSPDHIIGQSTVYLRVYFLGLPGALVYNFASALLRAQGDTKRPVYFLTIAGVVNVVLNLIFVVFFHWDVAGVAAATAISKYASAILVVWCLMQETGVMHFDPAKLRIDWPALKDIARIGLPAGFQSSLFSLSNVTIQSAINSMGGVIMAGSGAAQNIGGFIYTSANAFYQSTLTFTSQNAGAKKTDRINRVLKWNLLFAVAVPTAVGLAAYVAGPWLLGLYTDTPEVIQQGMIRMLWISSFYGVCGIMEVFIGVLRGLGYSTVTMITTLLGSCGFRLLWVATVFPTFGTPRSLFLCYPISWAITGMVLMVCFFILRPKTYAKIQEKVELQA